MIYYILSAICILFVLSLFSSWLFVYGDYIKHKHPFKDASILFLKIFIVGGIIGFFIIMSLWLASLGYANIE